MRRLALILLFSAQVFALPPAPVSQEQLVAESDEIGIVRVVKVVQVPKRPKFDESFVQFAAVRTEQSLKGNLPTQFTLRLNASARIFSCRPGELSPGRFLMFLRRDGTNVVRANHWYAEYPIEKSRVSWWQHGTNRPLNNVISEIRASSGVQRTH